MRRVVVAGSVVIAVLVILHLARPPDPLPGLPRIILWAWESPQDLRFVQPGSAGIAFLARTVWLDSAGASSRPRLQPLRFQPGTDLIAVVRMESKGAGLPDRADAVRETLPAARLEGVRALQIDFDARLTEREWYSAFLRDLQRAIPRQVPLVITALESWCDRDNWIAGLPVADATPMLFRMGEGDRTVSDFSIRLCRSSIGISTDEVPARLPRGRRIYIFHPGPWSRPAYEAAVAQARRWWQ